jgi:phage gpG-like protein
MNPTVDQSELDAKLARVEKASRSQPKAMQTVARELGQFVRNTFRDEIDPWGVPWPELAPATIQARLHGKGDDPLAAFSVKKLFESGDLYGSIDQTSDETSATVTEGEGLVYAAPQQFGNPSHLPWGHAGASLPARPSMPLISPDQVAFPNDWLQAVFLPIQEAIQAEVDA